MKKLQLILTIFLFSFTLQAQEKKQNDTIKIEINSNTKTIYVLGGIASVITKEDLVRDVKKSQIGLEAGVGIDVLMFTLDARYNLIGDMYQTKISDLNIDNVPVSTFVISVGWKFF